MKYTDDLWDVSKIETGTILRDWFDEGIRVLIMKGPNSMNVYMGISIDHPLAGFDYDALIVNCHGGLTFGSEGTDMWPKGYYWYGYDYAHAGDYTPLIEFTSDKKWTLGEIEKDTWEALYDFKKLVKLAEAIKRKP